MSFNMLRDTSCGGAAIEVLREINNLMESTLQMRYKHNYSCTQALLVTPMLECWTLHPQYALWTTPRIIVSVENSTSIW